MYCLKFYFKTWSFNDVSHFSSKECSLSFPWLFRISRYAGIFFHNTLIRNWKVECQFLWRKIVMCVWTYFFKKSLLSEIAWWPCSRTTSSPWGSQNDHSKTMGPFFLKNNFQKKSSKEWFLKPRDSTSRETPGSARRAMRAELFGSVENTNAHGTIFLKSS